MGSTYGATLRRQFVRKILSFSTLCNIALVHIDEDNDQDIFLDPPKWNMCPYICYSVDLTYEETPPKGSLRELSLRHC